MFCLSLVVFPFIASATQDFPAPGTEFTYTVNTTGDNPASLVLWERLGESQETVRIASIESTVVAKDVNGKTLIKAGPCLKLSTQNNKTKEANATHYYQISDEGLRYFYRENEVGEKKVYSGKPLWLPSGDHLKPGYKDLNQGAYYICVKDTGIPVFRNYLSPDLGKDKVVVHVQVGKMQKITVPAGTFEVWPVTNDFDVNTGSWLKKAHTVVHFVFWYAPSLKAVVKETSDVNMKAGILKGKAHIEKELISYSNGRK
jgi:hypothetical protein